MTTPATAPSNARPARGRRLVFASVGLLLTAFVVYAFLPDAVAVDAVPIRRGTLRITVDEDGVTRVKDRYVISAPLSGSLARVGLRAGDTVREGDVIARILPSATPLLDARSRAESDARIAAAGAGTLQAQSSVERARAALTLAQEELVRGRALLASGSSTRQSVDRLEAEARARTEELSSAEFGVRIARHEQTMAQVASGRVPVGNVGDAPFEVRSPVSGRVLRVFRTSDGPVGPGTQLVEIGDPAALEIVVDVLTRDAIAIHPGARVVLDRWGGDAPLDGRVRLVEPSAFTKVSALGVEEQRVNVIVDLATPHAEWSSLGDGFRVEASVVVDEVDEAILVPELATFRADGSDRAFEVVDGHARLRRLRVGRRNGLEVEILGGLDAHGRVVLHPSESLDDGARIRSRR